MYVVFLSHTAKPVLYGVFVLAFGPRLGKDVVLSSLRLFSEESSHRVVQLPFPSSPGMSQHMPEFWYGFPLWSQVRLRPWPTGRGLQNCSPLVVVVEVLDERGYGLACRRQSGVRWHSSHQQSVRMQFLHMTSERSMVAVWAHPLPTRCRVRLLSRSANMTECANAGRAARGDAARF